MKYKIGDKVRVRENLVVGNDYGEFTFLEDMAQHRSNVLMIHDYSSGQYLLENSGFWFAAEMLEPALKRGDKVSVGNGSAERLFLNHTEGAHYPYRCVTGGDEQKFWAGETFRTCNWPDCKPIEKPKPKKYTITDPEGKTVELNDSMAEFCMYLMRDDMKNKTIQIINS